MNDETRLPADVALLKRCREAGFSARKAERMVVELFGIESSMQNDTNDKFRELVAKIEELRSEIKAEVKELRSEIKGEVKAVEDRLLQVISWRLVIFMAIFTVTGAGLFALMGGLFVP